MAKRDTLSSRKLKRYKELNIDNHYLRRIKRRELFSKFFHSSNFKYSKILTSIPTPIFQFLSTSTNAIFDRVVGNFAIFLQPFPTYLNFRIFQILNYKYPERLIHNFPNHLIPRAEPVSAFLPGLSRIVNFDRTSSKVSADLPSSQNFQISTYRAIWSDDLSKFETFPLGVSPRQILFALPLPNENLFSKNNPWKYFKGHCAHFQLATKFSDDGAHRAATPKLQKSFDARSGLNVGLCNAVA